MLHKFLIIFTVLVNILLADTNQKDINNTDILFSINKKVYKLSDFPNIFQKLPIKKQKKFINRYLYYTLSLSNLKKEQQEYNKDINRTLAKKNIELQKKGLVTNKLQKILINQEGTLNTIAFNEVLKKHKDIDKEIQEFYKKNRDGYKMPNRVEISHIVLKDAKDANLTLLDIKKKNSIKYFAKISQEKSLDRQTALDGGYVGEVDSSSIGKKFFDTIWGNKDNGLVPKVIKLNNYYHIVYIFKKLKAEQRTLEEEKDSIKRYLLQKDIKEWKENNFQKIKNKTNVKFYKIKL